MSDGLVLAVDGGNSKTDVALGRTDGELLAFVRGPLSSPHLVGLDGALDTIEDLIDQAAGEAGLSSERPIAGVGAILMAGIDLPDEEQDLAEAVEERGLVRHAHVGNDTFAVLRAGTEDGWGIAVVCGAGINCVGVAPDGRHARFPALGPITGDWGGGYDLGLAALGAAVRAADGRGPRTALESAVPAHFDQASPHELAEAIHLERIDPARLGELPRVVFAHAADDDVAAGIVDRLEAEVVAFVRAALARLNLADAPAPVPVVLGGTLLRWAPARFTAAFEADLHAIAPRARVVFADRPPIVGAALLALDDSGAGADAKSRLARDLTAAADQAEPELVRRSDAGPS
jgi:N-acetylglucosamine kinase-like BadF-type ATPase